MIEDGAQRVDVAARVGRFSARLPRAMYAGVPSTDPAKVSSPKPGGSVSVSLTGSSSNAPAARSILPLAEIRTKGVLAGESVSQIVDRLRAALSKGAVPALEPGSMSYMMAKGSYLTDAGDHNGPHVMFYVPVADAATWGANLPGSPVGSGPYWFFSDSASKQYKDLPAIRVFTVSVARWSDGTPWPEHHHPS